MRRRPVLSAVVSVAVLVACKEAQSDHPYTPFGVVSVAEPPKPPPTHTPEPGIFAVQKAILAPAGARQWAFNGRTLNAAGSLTFEQALEADFDNDGSNEVVAWLTPDPTGPKPAGAATKPPGELWLYPSGTAESASSKPSKLFDTPGFLPVMGCKPQSELTRTGPQTVALRIEMRCEKPITGRMPTAALSVIAPRRESPHVMTLRIANNEDASKKNTDQLTLEISTLDRDQDGRDDIDLKISLQELRAAPEPNPAEVSFVWLDRKAGLSRDALLPTKNFRDIAALEVLRATGKNTSVKTLARIDAVRRLFGALCAEGHVPTVFDQDNNPLTCHVTTDTLGQLATAEIRSWLTQRAWGNAVTALLRTSWYGGPIPEKVRTDLTTEVEKAIPPRAARVLAVSMSKAREGGSIPHFSALAFDAEGLLIQNSEGVIRMSLDTLEENDASEEIDAWPLTVISPQGERLMGVAYPCDRQTVTLLASSESGAAAPIATSLLAPRPGLCGGNGKSADLPLRPISWGIGGVKVLLGGSEIGPTAGDAIPLGSARSHNGEHSVIATELGLLVLHKTSAELWRVESSANHRLQDCVIDDSARHIACVDKGRAVVLGLAPAAPTPVPAGSAAPPAPALPPP